MLNTQSYCYPSMFLSVFQTFPYAGGAYLPRGSGDGSVVLHRGLTQGKSSWRTDTTPIISPKPNKPSPFSSLWKRHLQHILHSHEHHHHCQIFTKRHLTRTLKKDPNDDSICWQPMDVNTWKRAKPGAALGSMVLVLGVMTNCLTLLTKLNHVLHKLLMYTHR